MNIVSNEIVYDKLWAGIEIRSHTQYPEWKILKDHISPDKTVLEIGPGIRPKIPIEGSHFMDISSECINKINELGGKAVKGSVTDLPYNDASFDIICGFDVVEHIQDDVKVLNEINRILRPKGHFFFSVPLHQRLFDDFDKECGHTRRYEPEELINKLEDAGYDITAISKHGLRPKNKLANKIAAYFLKTIPELSVKISNIFYRFSLRLTEPNTMLITNNYVNEMNKMDNVLIVARKR